MIYLSKGLVCKGSTEELLSITEIDEIEVYYGTIFSDRNELCGM